MWNDLVVQGAGTISTFKTRTDYAVDYLRQGIMSGKIRSGEPLRQADIARELGISHIPVREALLRLAEQGLVRITPHKGAVAMELSNEEMEELTRLRLLIETHALKQAFAFLDEDSLNKAEILLQRYQESIQAGDPAEVWYELNLDFHLALYLADRYPVTARLLRDLHRLADRYMSVLMLGSEWTGRARGEHQQLIQLVREGEIAPCLELLRTHILRTGEDVKTCLRELGHSK